MIAGAALALGAPQVSTALLGAALSDLAFALAWTRATNACARAGPRAISCAVTVRRTVA